MTFGNYEAIATFQNEVILFYIDISVNTKINTKKYAKI